MIGSRLIAVVLEDKNKETNQSTVPALWLPIKMILKLTRLGPTVLCYSCIGHVLLTTVPETLTVPTIFGACLNQAAPYTFITGRYMYHA